MDLLVREGRGPGAGDLEIVERKGRGHPDTLCDAVSERLSVALCRFHQARFGTILHHNVDKALLVGGASRPRFGGGEVVRPLEWILAGRAATEFRGVPIPLEELARESAREVMRASVRHLDPERHLSVSARLRPGASGLVDLLRRDRPGGAAANDTSLGVGFAPRSELEDLVLAVERFVGSGARPEVGEDVKVMGKRRGKGVRLLVAAAFVDRHLRDLADYAARADALRGAVREFARERIGREVEVVLNAADDPARGEIYLTVTGTSAEMGDDGETGRGNRASGLITPFRPMSMEATAGKNPVAHVGKLYNVLATRVAESIVRNLPEVAGAECLLLSRIGAPVMEPETADLRLEPRSGPLAPSVGEEAARLLRAELGRPEELAESILRGEATLF